MRDAGHRTPDKAKIIYPPPRGVDMIQNGRHFWRDKIFLKIGMTTLQIYPWVKNFVEIPLSSTVFEI